MIVYMVDGGKYFSLDDALKLGLQTPRGLYVNLTNRCDNDCVFCLRRTKEMMRGSSLWLEREPTVEEVIAELRAVPWSSVSEVVFCGFGEPTLRLEELIELLRWLKKKSAVDADAPEHQRAGGACARAGDRGGFRGAVGCGVDQFERLDGGKIFCLDALDVRARLVRSNADFRRAHEKIRTEGRPDDRRQGQPARGD